MVLPVSPGREAEFEAAFAEASTLIASIEGYLSHELHRGIEQPSQYLLLVTWETLAAHTVGFRESPQYEQWSAALHHCYDPFPQVEHYERIA